VPPAGASPRAANALEDKTIVNKNRSINKKQ
jgi:hypothetical protein